METKRNGPTLLGGYYLTEHDLRGAGFRGLGRNVRIHTRASVYGVENISLGDNVRIDDFSITVATGPLDVGNHVSIPNFCFVGSKYGIVLEDFVTLAPGVKIFTAADDYSGNKLTGPTLPAALIGGSHGKVVLEEHVIIGADTVILPGVVIGRGCSVGALSLVKESLGPWGIYAGIPVRRLKDRSKNLLNSLPALAELEAA